MGMYDDEEKDGLRKSLPCPECGQTRSRSRSPRIWERYGRYTGRRALRPGFVLLCLAFIILHFMLPHFSREELPYRLPLEPSREISSSPVEDITLAGYNSSETKFHFLITANTVNLDLCRTLLTAGILTYPSPTVLGPSGKDVSRFARIPRVLDYLRSLNETHAEDLVLIVNGHETQFQLPVDVLLHRYNVVIKGATRLLVDQFDGAIPGKISQRILFGANKRCIGAATDIDQCDPTPPSSAADDLYGNYTDVAQSYNDWFHYRPRYPDPGFILGPLGAMKAVFERAEQLIEESKKASGLAIMTEQAVFARIFSEQERWRDSLHPSGPSSWLRAEATAATSGNNTAKASKEISELNPSVDYEFGVFVDYHAQLSHSTMDSEIGRDVQFIKWDDDDSTTFHEQANNKHQRDGKKDCVVDVPDSLPSDVASMGPPFYLIKFHDYRQGSTYEHAVQDDDVYIGPHWKDVPLYTHLCFGTVPVMIHHNGDNLARNETWGNLWLWQRASMLLVGQRELMSEEGSGAVDFADWADFKENPGIKQPGGAWTDDGAWVDWGGICPAVEYGQALYTKDP